MLNINLCGLEFENPTILAAGILGSTASSLNRVIDSGVGAVITKSFSKSPNNGYHNPTIVEVSGGFLNAIGLSNPGVDSFKEELKLIKNGPPKIASIYGESPDEFSYVAEEVENLVDMFELNVSCPHAMGGYGSTIGENSDLVFDIVSKMKDSVNKPVVVKLTPNVSNIVEIALACEESDCDAISLINTLGPGMAIDITTGRPILSNKFGGLSGPVMKPIAVRCVYDVYSNVNVPIIGVGGILNSDDVIEFLYAGASAVQIGSGVSYNGLVIFEEICNGLEQFMDKNGFKKIDELSGLSHNF